MQKVRLGGDILGAGKKMEVELHGFERSTHDLSEVFRTTMSPGTLVPCMVKVGLPGDTIDLEYKLDVQTLPTVGALFGQFKIQIDTFVAPMRNYNGKMYLNLVGQGLKMDKVKFPKMKLKANDIDRQKELEGQQINTSCILSYLGMKGIGYPESGGEEAIRDVNATSYLMYVDTAKKYYCDKQSGVGYVIHHPLNPFEAIPTYASINNVAPPDFNGPITNTPISQDPEQPLVDKGIVSYTEFEMNFSSDIDGMDPSRVELYWSVQPGAPGPVGGWVPITEIWEEVMIDQANGGLIGRKPFHTFASTGYVVKLGKFRINREVRNMGDIEPRLESFDLTHVDEMRMGIMKWVDNDTPFMISNEDHLQPYCYLFEKRAGEEKNYYAIQGNQEGLIVKTYMSDQFTAYLDQDSIDGPGGINELSALQVVNNQITMDEVIVKKKIYEMLQRIQVSGGTSDNYQEVQWGIKRDTGIEDIMYVGGLQTELVFQEVVSQSTNLEAGQPLGTIAGKGRILDRQRGGKVRIKLDQPSYVMALISFTPRVDYSQGNGWDMDLDNWSELHVPMMDQIGFEDVLVERMAWWTTKIKDNGELTRKSAGKVPAWTNYTTSVNKTFGNLALPDNLMYMTLNRRYEPYFGTGEIQIRDLTKYVDPAKYNYIFSYTRRDAQNLIVQVGIEQTWRRKMSAKQMPGL